MSADFKKTGFTIVEFVIVLVIIAIGLAILVPAIQASREKSRLEACRNNMKQLGLAIHKYNNINKKLPPSASLCSVTGEPPYQAGGPSFMVRLLPMLKYESMYDGLAEFIDDPAAKTTPDFFLTAKDKNLAIARATVIPEFICPSNPNRSALFLGNTNPKSKIALTNYKAMGATNMVSLSYCLDPKGTTAQPYPPIPPVATEHPDGAMFPGAWLRIANFLDSTAHTIMAVETIDDSGTTPNNVGSAWVAGACATMVGLPSQNSGPVTRQITYQPSDQSFPFPRPVGFNGKYAEEADPRIQSLKTYLAYDFSGADKGKYPDPSTGTNVGNMPTNIYGPSAGHPMVVNHLFADCDVKSLRKNIDYCLYFFTLTRDHGDNVLVAQRQKT
jgi:prepilin-type N-terminal cleavage/methylation domain-containing protein